MEVSPEERILWESTLAQALNIVHEVAPQTPINHVVSAAWKQFQNQKWIVPHIVDPQPEVPIAITKEVVDEISEQNTLVKKSQSSKQTPKKSKPIESQKPKEVLKSVKTADTKSPMKEKSQKKKKTDKENSSPKKLSTYNMYVKYQSAKLKDSGVKNSEKLSIIAAKWKTLENEDKEHFLKKHGHEFQE